MQDLRNEAKGWIARSLDARETALKADLLDLLAQTGRRKWPPC